MNHPANRSGGHCSSAGSSSVENVGCSSLGRVQSGCRANAYASHVIPATSNVDQTATPRRSRAVDGVCSVGTRKASIRTTAAGNTTNAVAGQLNGRVAVPAAASTAMTANGATRRRNGFAERAGSFATLAEYVFPDDRTRISGRRHSGEAPAPGVEPRPRRIRLRPRLAAQDRDRVVNGGSPPDGRDLIGLVLISGPTPRRRRSFARPRTRRGSRDGRPGFGCANYASAVASVGRSSARSRAPTCGYVGYSMPEMYCTVRTTWHE